MLPVLCGQTMSRCVGRPHRAVPSADGLWGPVPVWAVMKTAAMESKHLGTQFFGAWTLRAESLGQGVTDFLKDTELSPRPTAGPATPRAAPWGRDVKGEGSLWERSRLHTTGPHAYSLLSFGKYLSLRLVRVSSRFLLFCSEPVWAGGLRSERQAPLRQLHEPMQALSLVWPPCTRAHTVGASVPWTGVLSPHTDRYRGQCSL